MKQAMYERVFVGGVAPFRADIANMLQTAKTRSEARTHAIFHQTDEGCD